MKVKKTGSEPRWNRIQGALQLRKKVSLLVAAFWLVGGLGLANGANNCTKTSEAAKKACKKEAKDDYWIAVGNCYNLPTNNEKKKCRKKAEAVLEETIEECKDQFKARREICDELGEAPYHPQINPADFVDPTTIDTGSANPYFPLVPGTEWMYESVTDEGTETITVTVTDETKEIEYPAGSGLIYTCRVVHDVVKLDGEVIEDTYDWYAQDEDGNVWYFGEIAQEFEDGELVGIEGSWKAGVDGAKPGILMPGNPQEGDYYRQEFLLGEAEDMGEVVSRGEESVTVPIGGDTTYNVDVLKTREWTPIEPDVLEFKYYAPGIGLVLEENPENGGRVELVGMTTP